MAQILVIDENVQALFNGLREYAEANPITMEQLLRTMAGSRPPTGDFPEYCIEVPIGVRVVFSLEHQKRGLVRHVSVSVNGKLPSPYLMEQVLELLGFRNKMENCLLRLEPNNVAINALEYVEGGTIGRTH